MSDAPLIFVSHSSRNDQLTRDVCGALDTPVPGGRAYRVLADFEDLKPGMEWPRYLIEWMARCHSAVILLTKEAAESDWVLKEATILTARRSLDPAFKLFVVRFDGTDDLLERHGFDPLFLKTIQQIPYTDAAVLAAAVRAELGDPDPSPTPFDALVGRLQDLLEQVGPNALKTVAGKLNVIPDRLTITQTERERWINTIARHLVCGHLGAFAGIHELIDEFTASDAEVVRKILRFVSPYWIDPLAAFRLPRVLKSAPRRAAALNGAEVVEFTAPMYVRRAHQPSLQFDVIPIAGGMHDKYVEHVTSEICGSMRMRKKTSATKTDADIIADLRKQRSEWYAVLPPPLPDSEALNAVLDLFPTITFILWTGETIIRDASLTRVEWLEPPVDIDREWREREDLEAAEKVIERMTS